MYPKQAVPFPICAPNDGLQIPRVILMILTALAYFAGTGISRAAEVIIEWDPVQDTRVAYYEVDWGTASGQYDHKQNVESTSITIADLSPGQTYYFAARACAEGGEPCSEYSNELSASIPYAQPEATFTLSATSGLAPYDVAFTDSSAGVIDSYSWDFGDGTNSTEPSPTHTYNQPGTYSPTLTVTGPGGSSSMTSPEDIYVGHPAPIPDFTASATAGEIPLTVTFTDASEGQVAACKWAPGDGSSYSGCTLVHTYTEPGVYTVSLEAQGPDAAATKTKPDLIAVTAQSTIAADFTSGPTTGGAPLTVAFTDSSSGEITDYTWEFGDGAVSSEASPVHTYDQPGEYDVTLTVSGPYGDDTLMRAGYVQISNPELAIETGEVALDHQWQWVEFQRSFTDPIVVVKPPTGAGGDPATVRIDDVQSEGFWVRIQEWAYLDGSHMTERVGYIVVERGHHPLPDGSWLEAGRLEVSGDQGYLPYDFGAPFGAVPVVIGNVATMHDASPVTTRMRSIEQSGFEIHLQKEENSTAVHGLETVNYLAWEPSSGEIGGLRFDVGHTADAVTHAAHHIEFDDGSLAANPVFVADMQSADGGDTANLRWNRTGIQSVEVWVDEERSRDSETNHTTETLGYIAIDHSSLSSAPPLNLEVGEVSVGSEWQRVSLVEDFIDPIVVATAARSIDVDPAVVQIDDIDTEGFSLRLRQWDYLDGTQAPEIVTYLVVERGYHRLADGTAIAAGHFQADTTDGFSATAYAMPFNTTPVVLASVTTVGDSATATHRIRDVTPFGFEASLQKEEAAPDNAIISETVHYVAWESFIGEWGGLHLQVGRTSDAVTGERHTIVYDTPSALAPVLLADMQSRDGPDTANLRWDTRDGISVDVWVDEEQSRDSEVRHTTETVGYIIVNEAVDILP